MGLYTTVRHLGAHQPRRYKEYTVDGSIKETVFFMCEDE
jgi:hypothetical protein